MLHNNDLSPIWYNRVCEAEGVSVPWNRIVKGYDNECERAGRLLDKLGVNWAGEAGPDALVETAIPRACKRA
jgi:hypothetical protein